MPRMRRAPRQMYTYSTNPIKTPFKRQRAEWVIKKIPSFKYFEVLLQTRCQMSQKRLKCVFYLIISVYEFKINVDFRRRILFKVSKFEKMAVVWSRVSVAFVSSWPLDTLVPQEPSARHTGIVLEVNNLVPCVDRRKEKFVFQNIFKVKPIFASLETRKTAIKRHRHLDPVSLNTEDQKFQHRIL